MVIGARSICTPVGPRLCCCSTLLPPRTTTTLYTAHCLIDGNFAVSPALGERLDLEPDRSNDVHLFLTPLVGSVYTCVVVLDGESVDGRFVLKLAQGEEECESLRREYKTYLALKEAHFRGVVEVYGLFQSDAPGMRSLGLVMAHGGRSFLHRSKECKAKLRQKFVVKQFEDILEELKRNGIVHRRLRLEHFVLDKFKGPDGKENLSVSLVGWKSAQQLGSQPAITSTPETAGMDDADVSFRRPPLSTAEGTNRENIMTSKREARRVWAENEGEIEYIRRFLTI